MARTVIITGGDSGIGKAAALRLASKGYDVGITWHNNKERAELAVKEIENVGGRVEKVQLELQNETSCVRAIDDLANRLGRLDVLVNNAAVLGRAPFLEMTFEHWRSVLSVNLDGQFVCAQRATQKMVSQGEGGRIINVTSVHELTPLGPLSAYCASKGGLGLLTKAMAIELATHGITVNTVGPGLTATAMSDMENVDVTVIANKGIPLGRAADPSEIAPAIELLASPDSTYITGETLIVDGGLMQMAAIPAAQAQTIIP